MADKITWADKESLVTDPTIAEINKVTDNNMNEIKSVTNTNADELAEKIVYDENDITENTSMIIEEVPEGSNIPYLNSEIAIGGSNEDNRPVWFKQGKNLCNNETLNLAINYQTNKIIGDGSSKTVYAYVPTNTNITISKTSVTNRFRVGLLNSIPAINDDINVVFRDDDSSTLSTTINTSTYTIVAIQYTNSNQTTNIQIEIGNIATTYEPYVTPSIIVDNREIYQKQEITTSSATIDSTYISNTEQNLITRVGQLVEFDFIFTTTGTWTSTTKMFTGLPKPNTTAKIRFVALKTNPEVPLRFKLNADGSIQNGWSNATISSGQIIEGHITYITID